MDVFVLKLSEAGSLAYGKYPGWLRIGLHAAHCRRHVVAGTRGRHHAVVQLPDGERIAAQGTTAVHARASDVAGNLETPGETLALSIDSGVPSIAIAAPGARDYLHSGVLQLSFAATDSVSGLAAANPTAALGQKGPSSSRGPARA